MSDNPRRHPYLWERYVDDAGSWRTVGGAARRPAGEELAALRRGIGRDAGTVPELWPYYETVNTDELGRRGLVSDALIAEHVALSLYGLHQQSQKEPMHRPGRGIGRSLYLLRSRGAFSSEAIDRRFNAAATASTQNELTLHLRSLVTLLRGEQIALDYTQLVADLTQWSWDDGRARARRRWGGDYFGWSTPAAQPAPESSPTA